MATMLHVATRKGLFDIVRANGRWAVTAGEFLGDNVTLTMQDPRSGCEFAALDHGHFGVKLHRRKPGGDWEEIAVPAYPSKPEGLVDPDGWGQDIPWTLMKIWALQPGAADQPGLIWCGTIPGGLFRSEDDGESWQLVQSLWNEPLRNKWFGGGADWPGIHSICVDPRDPDTVRLGVSCGGVWTTTDRGETWKCTAEGMRADFLPPEQAGDPWTQDPHMMVQCTAQPDRLWVQHHNGIFVSSDGARSWQELPGVKPSSFGFAVAVHPHDGDTAWFVPGIKDEKRIPVDGRLVVTRTRDGGVSFDVLARGLPQDHAYDLIYRHGLDVDDSGDMLAMGSTTGGLWVSENGGDDWSLVSHTLPPIHSVRFV